MFFTIEKIENQLHEIRSTIYRECIDIQRFKYNEGPFPHELPGAHYPNFDDSTWDDFNVGQTWGGYDRVAWFRTWIDIPEHLRGQKLALRFLVGPRDGGGSTAETMLYLDGYPLQGLDLWHEEAVLPGAFAGKARLCLALKAWSGVLETPPQRRFKLAQLALIDEGAERLYFTLTGLVKSARMLDENDLRRARLLNAANQAIRLVDYTKIGSEAYYQSLAAAADRLAASVAALQVSEIKPRVIGVGHSHIDMAWLWRLAHTREKAARSFSTVLNLMRQYPEYRFLHSSPQLYKFLEQDYPEIFEQVKQKVAAGAWEVTGGMWVEADTNLTSGESLVRQFLFGRRYVRQTFGVEMNLLWLPDVFGYSGALPQIIKKSGLKYFLTSKISWSQFNRFPYDTFRWRGIDGTEVLTHFVTTPENNTWFYTYNGQLEPAEVKGIWDNYRQKDLNDELLLLFGWGDGGGGPTKEMLESGRVLRRLPGVPEVELGLAEPYFERLGGRLEGQEVPVWDGELYLEYHRGTYTSQAFNKRANRRSEFLYHDAEWLSALADVILHQDNYPQAALNAGWEKILLNQFHDILPGSSIHQVYQDSRADYQVVAQTGAAAVALAGRSIANRIRTPVESVLVFNSLGWEREGLVALPWTDDLAGVTLLVDGCPAPAQRVEEDGVELLLVETNGSPSLGYKAFELVSQPALAQEMAGLPVSESERGNGGNGRSTAAGSNEPGAGGQIDLADPSPDPPEGQLAGGETQRMADLTETKILPLAASVQALSGLSARPGYLENSFYRLQLNSQGQIESLFDKRCSREVLAPGGRANVLQVFEDKPMAFDAWDIDIYYQEKMREITNLVESAVEETGPVRATLRLKWQYGESTIVQRISLYRLSPRIDFRTEADWHESQVLLKAAFPVDIRATRATYDIQFGSLERPTHWNTSWDYARFETVGHKWVDLSEGSYGVALLNDCKYGHDVKGNLLRLTLIKSAVRPDPTADKGRHLFTYSLLPHDGDWRAGDVVRHAYDLNEPLFHVWLPAQPQGDLPAEQFFVTVDSPHVIVETVKKAEDPDGEDAGDASTGPWIVRVYEYQQSRSSAVRLRFGFPLRKAVECNLVEEDEQPVVWDESCLTFSIKPFEIKTFKVWF